MGNFITQMLVTFLDKKVNVTKKSHILNHKLKTFPNANKLVRFVALISMTRRTS